jgi:predicted PurR-regulated permease PerM
MTILSERPLVSKPLPPDPPPRKRVLRVQISLSTMVSMTAIAVAAWLAIRLFPVFLVLITSLVLVGTLSPAVEWLEARGMRRTFAIALVFGAMFVGAVLFVTLTVPEIVTQLNSLVEQEPEIRKRLAHFLARSRLTTGLADGLRTLQYDALLKSSMASAFAFSTKVLEFLAYAVASIFLALYILIDRDRLRGGLFAIVPRAHHIRLSRIILNLETIVGGYLRGQLITCALMGVFMFGLLTAVGVPNALPIAVFGGLADVLPYIGVFLTIGPALVAAMPQGPAVVMTVLVAILVYEEVESRVLVPLVYGRALRLPSSVILFALVVGSSLLGIIGALFALPVAAGLLMLIDELRIELPGAGVPEEAAGVQKSDEENEQEYERRANGLPVEEAAAIAVEISADRRKAEGNGDTPAAGGTG